MRCGCGLCAFERVQASYSIQTDMNPWLLVLDTNVVLDWLHFRDPRVAGIAAAIASGAATLVTAPACLEELRRVLEYPRFGLDTAAQANLFSHYRALALQIDVPELASPELPKCRDCDDQKFLELAWHAHAHCLVTKDRALLKLACRVANLGRFTVVLPDAVELNENRA